MACRPASCKCEGRRPEGPAPEVSAKLAKASRTTSGSTSGTAPGAVGRRSCTRRVHFRLGLGQDVKCRGVGSTWSWLTSAVHALRGDTLFDERVDSGRRVVMNRVVQSLLFFVDEARREEGRREPFRPLDGRLATHKTLYSMQCCPMGGQHSAQHKITMNRGIIVSADDGQ